MSNKEIAKTFAELADLMELHDANQFKIRSYRNAYVSIRRFPEPIEELETEMLLDQRGIGKSVAFKIEELLDYGEIAELEDLRRATPKGIREMLQVKGLGPKKIKVIWKDMGIEDVTDLMYACNENRLIEAKGFGQKTQSDLLAKLQFFLKNQDKVLYATAEILTKRLQESLHAQGIPSVFAGELLRRTNIVDDIQLWCHGQPSDLKPLDGWEQEASDRHVTLTNEDGQIVTLKFTSERLEDVIMIQEVPERIKEYISIQEADWNSEMIRTRPSPELWDNEMIDFSDWNEKDLIGLEDVRGVIHNHSVYSDGSHSVEEMARACIQKGYDYLVMSDHSKSAFYANGLDEDRVIKQWEEIDALNETFGEFKIFKSIESDILYDGSLDYEDAFLKGFDLVIASVHSQLKMDEQKATSRLIRAIEHPATRILGHMTGRLLLGREGYPVHHQKIIDACAANDVVIELNANPYRLDMDWTWIHAAQEKGVMISINPDAHHIDGIDDIRYGVLSARKGGLRKTNCLCCMSISEFETWIRKK